MMNLFVSFLFHYVKKQITKEYKKLESCNQDIVCLFESDLRCQVRDRAALRRECYGMVSYAHIRDLLGISAYKSYFRGFRLKESELT